MKALTLPSLPLSCPDLPVVGRERDSFWQVWLLRLLAEIEMEGLSSSN
jgi:hypothetical protein